MKTIITLAFLTFLFQSNLFGQSFIKSKNTFLRIDNEHSIKKINENDQYEGVVFLQDFDEIIIKSFVINTDSYSEEYSYVEEITETQLENVNRVIKVNIENCGCYCNADIYYWLVTNNNKWIMLPKIEQYDYEIGNTYQEYIFRKENKNIIELVEFREKMNDKPNKNNPGGFDIERIYEKKIGSLTWNGEKLQEK